MPAAKRYWLMKTEPESYSIDDLKRDKATCWDGVRNYQARNFMRDDMKVGDLILLYHSNAKPPGVVGVAKVKKTAYPDHTALDPNDHHYDPKATEENPIWLMVDVAFVEKFPRLVGLDELKGRKDLDGLMVIQRGSRLSIQPVDKKHFDIICKMAKK